MQLSTDEPEKFAARFGFLKLSGKGRGGGHAVLFLYPAHHHTHVLGFDDDGYSQRPQNLLYDIAYFDGQALLHLKAAGEDIYHARYLAQTYYVTVGNVGDMRLAEKGQDVVLAQRVHLDIFDQHHFAAAFGKHGGSQDGFGILSIALGQKLHGLCCPLGSLPETFSLGVFT